MKLLTLKFPATCADANCGAALPAGTRAKWYGRGRVYGLDCHQRTPALPCETCGGLPCLEGCARPERERRPDAPCWVCGDSRGFFRNKGPASPVACDSCEAKNRLGEANERANRHALRLAHGVDDPGYVRDPAEDAADRWSEEHVADR